jgi:hypothetical protein
LPNLAIFDSIVTVAPFRKIPQKSRVTAFALANYRHMNQGKGTLKPVGHNLGTVEEGSERGISVTIWAHLKTKKPTFVGCFASTKTRHLVDDFAKSP